jgi:hypothetical protein
MVTDRCVERVNRAELLEPPAALLDKKAGRPLRWMNPSPDMAAKLGRGHLDVHRENDAEAAGCSRLLDSGPPTTLM